MGTLIEHIITAYRANLAYARALCEGIPPEIEARAAGPGLENHPVFIIGHLCTGAGLTAEDLGHTNDIDPAWRDLFERRGPSDERKPGNSAYPSLNDTLAELTRLHAIVERCLEKFPPEKLDEPDEWRLDAYYPTFADGIVFMCLTHEALHLGQLAAWRRANGLPSAMATM